MHTQPTYGLFRFVEPDLSVSAQERSIFAGPAPKKVQEESLQLHDFRTSKDVRHGQAGLDAQSFTYVDHTSRLTGEELLAGDNAERIYAPEMLDLVLKVTGASRGVVYNIAFRHNLAERTKDLYSIQSLENVKDKDVLALPRDRVIVVGRGGDHLEPARHTHCDMTLESLSNTLRLCRRDICEAAKSAVEAEDLRKNGAVVKVPRYAAYSVWRPLKTVKRDPIAVLDYRSIDQSELVVTDFRVPSEVTDKGEYICQAWLHLPPKHPEKLKWYWMPEQKPDEVLLIKFADSAAAEDENIAAGCIHCSPEIAGTEDEEVRYSVEARVYAFWD